MAVKHQDGSSLTRLVGVMQQLLAPDGCPWDREQTFDTLKKYALEEAAEVVDAIDALGVDAGHAVGPARELGPDDRAVLELREELGDLLLQVVFQAEMAESRGWFGMDDVVDAITRKMERRHPHVFGDATVSGSDEVLSNWEKIKAQEKNGRGTLGGMPKNLPALLFAFRLGEKASSVGFDWPDDRGPREKIAEETRELDEALANGDADAIEHEVGDLLFSVVNLARKRGVDPEGALRAANARFTKRFEKVEHAVRSSGKTLGDVALAELDAHWDAAKREG